MLNKRSGRVAYAIMSFGGFLGIGESYHPLPWRTLNYEPGIGGYVVDIDSSRLQGAPYYDSSTDPIGRTPRTPGVSMSITAFARDRSNTAPKRAARKWRPFF